MRDFSGLAEFQFDNDHDDVSVSKIKKESSSIDDFSAYLDNFEDKDNKLHQWCKPGEMITLGNHVITSGCFYIGEGLMASNNRGVESSLINPKLTHKFSSECYQDSTLKYWPEYGKISATCRGTYLFWLSGERDDPNTPLGYVFLYFYGLERRLLVDYPNGLVSDAEYLELYNEIKRLKNIYEHHRSFYGYSSKLLNFLSVAAPHIIEPNINLGECYEITFEFKYVLANLMRKNKPWPASLALKWIELQTNSCSKALYTRCKDELMAVFKHHYKHEFGDGIVVTSSNARLQFNYQTASKSLSGFKPIVPDLYDPGNAKEENIQLAGILLKSERELEAYSRFLGKLENARNPDARNQIHALVLLPKSYLISCEVPFISNFAEWLSHSVQKCHGDVSLSEIWLKLDMLIAGKVTKKEFSLLTNLLEKTGHGFSPDPRYIPEKLKFDSDISIFNTDFEGVFEPSSEFYRMQALIKFGAILFLNDINFDFNTTIMFLIDDDALSEIEKDHLISYFKWIVSSDLSLKGLKPFVKNLSVDDCLLVSQALIGIYATGGIVCMDKMKSLEKIYIVLGLAKETVVTDVHNASSVTYRQVKLSNKQSNSFEIDHEYLKKIESETSDVQSILGDIFNEDSIESEKSPIKDATNETKIEIENYHGLSGNNLILYKALIKNDEWESEAVQSLCKELNLMLDGAIEEINDWAFDLVDAPIIEIEDSIIIDLEIIEEIEGI